MNFIKFLGTAGARIVVAKQLRASGGMWLSFRELKTEVIAARDGMIFEI